MADKLEQMTQIVQKFCEERDWDQFHTPKELAIGLVTESSELLDEFRFLSEDQVTNKLSNPKGRKAIEDEVADVLFFLLRFSQMNGISLSEVLAAKIEKNAGKYPLEKAKSNNQKYDEL